MTPQQIAHEKMIEDVAKALFTLDHGHAFGPPDNWSWETWPETNRQASLAYQDHSRQGYREQAKVALAVIASILAKVTPEMVARVAQQLHDSMWPPLQLDDESNKAAKVFYDAARAAIAAFLVASSLVTGGEG
jgi:hypothetical protein